MAALSGEDVEKIRSAIQAYRDAWLASVNSDEFRKGVLSATITGRDTPDGWRAYEQDKRIRRAEENLIGMLESYKESAPAVRYQGIVYSIRDAKATDLGTYRFHVLVEREDTTLNLDWPVNVPVPRLPPGPRTW